jgi:sensor histidine kinase YesM
LTNNKTIPFKHILTGTGIVSLVPPVFQIISYFVLDIPNCDIGPFWQGLISTWIFSVLITFALFFVNIYIHIKGHTYFGQSNESRRIILSVLVSLIASNIIIYVFWIAFDGWILHLPVEGRTSRIFSNQVLATVLVIIVDLVMEINQYISKLKLSIAAREQLEKEMMRAQLEGLKTQISPHFLFNNLSILSSLVETEPELSVQFIHHLSKAYRYLLEKSALERIPLKTELDFVKTYTFLLKIRFEEKLEIVIDIPEADKLRYSIVPLTLQLLVENAVKHNRMSEEEPLKVYLKVNDNYLEVNNRIQPRPKNEPSTGLGLQNIINRYKLLTEKPVVVTDENEMFSVKIPFLS